MSWEEFVKKCVQLKEMQDDDSIIVCVEDSDIKNVECIDIDDDEVCFFFYRGSVCLEKLKHSGDYLSKFIDGVKELKPQDISYD